MHQEDADFDYLFGDCSQRAVSRFGCGKPNVIKQTLEMQSEDTSATNAIGVTSYTSRTISITSQSSDAARDRYTNFRLTALELEIR